MIVGKRRKRRRKEMKEKEKNKNIRAFLDDETELITGAKSKVSSPLHKREGDLGSKEEEQERKEEGNG